MKKTYDEIREFLYYEAELLDEWKLEEWASLFTSSGMYLIPPIGNPNADNKQHLYFAYDDRARLEQRAKRLLKKEAHVEFPHSTTVRNIHNISIKDIDETNNRTKVRCNFTTFRTKREKLDSYVGVLEYQLVLENDELKIEEKKVILKLDSLRPQGKISVIL
ncbi:aromatic-ring-hydroxylating dioxygenase subunit beta [Bacillus sp. EB600]|uniref:aromatic-ring-hydroxylating dioxygenase subunit beta n=1 Tax=Bacillus sp. EB600 TaxID=2806345 RepID=UPI002108CB17|nr:aromatic-ring-hydroxylating dioxygenase subunit beta [Bacillus sp. EB600]MCQ6279941.1 aromatic-ring-hydroxylating dioxygenase subunit beta [Bacillus sp. EB600]